MTKSIETVFCPGLISRQLLLRSINFFNSFCLHIFVVCYLWHLLILLFSVYEKEHFFQHILILLLSFFNRLLRDICRWGCQILLFNFINGFHRLPFAYLFPSCSSLVLYSTHKLWRSSHWWQLVAWLMASCVYLVLC